MNLCLLLEPKYPLACEKSVLLLHCVYLFAGSSLLQAQQKQPATPVSQPIHSLNKPIPAPSNRVNLPDSLYRAQKTVRSQALKKLTGELDEKYRSVRETAFRLARKHRWTITGREINGSLMALQGLDEGGQPHYYVSYNNNAAVTTRTNLLWTGNRLGYNLSGGSLGLSGKLGIWDAGKVRDTHRELTGRVTQQDNNPTFETHATHVAGTMISAGLLPTAKGMAYGANLKAWDFNSDTPEIAGAAAGLLVSNHSYGSLCGWRLAGRGWEWWGEPTLNETYDWKFGYYNSTARDWDQIAYNAPYYLPVKAAGNNRNENGPADGTTHFIANSNLTSNTPRSRNDGYDIVTTNGNAKNILTVGAANPIPDGYDQPSDVVISAFSSWGPTDDGRIKPDLVGDGVNVLSAGSGSDQAYLYSSGTSMASPNVAGSLLLLQEHYARLNQGNFMRAATLKGLVLHSTNEAGRAPGPDYVFGWGLLNAEKAASVLTNAEGNHLVQERELLQNQTYSFQVVASGKGPLEVTVCWTDPEGKVSPLTPDAVNNRTPKLVNDLDVRVAEGNNTYLPWTLDPDNPANAAIPGDNIRDNVEKVYVPNAVAGKSYLVNISHKGTLQRVPQAYSIVISGAGGRNYCSSKAGQDGSSKINRFTFGSFGHTSTADCAAYSDFTYLSATATAGQTVPVSLTLGSCGATTPVIDAEKTGKVFADWNGDGDFDDANELVATTDAIGGTGTYTATITVPPGVRTGSATRIRVVCVETNDPAQVQACGIYPKGETQDYQLQFEAPAKDVGVVGLVSPEPGLCANPTRGGVTVIVRNFGTVAQSAIPVTVVIREEESGKVTALNGVYEGELLPNSEGSVLLTGTFDAQTGKRYGFLSRTSLLGDADSTNNGMTTSRTVSDLLSAPTASATSCGNDPTALKGDGEGTLFWYDAPAGGQLLAAGNLAYTSFKPANQTYYAALNEMTGKLGPSGKADFSGGTYSQFSSAVNFTAQVPLMIESARLYIGHSGRITFTIERSDGFPVARTTLDVTASRTVTATGESPDDADDTGAVYYLYLTVPAAGNYRLTAVYENGATIFQSNAGVAGYPFTLPKVVSITGNTNGANLYSYLYDVRVKAAGCPSPRIPVVATVADAAVASITPAGPLSICEGDSLVLRANKGTGLGYQWLKDGVVISHSTTDSLTVSATGDYTVQVTNATGCRHSSTPVTVSANPIVPVAVSVVPASSPELCPNSAVGVLLRAIPEVDATTLAFQWQKNGEDIAQATAATYLATATGNYTVTVSQSACSFSTSLPLSINQDAIDVIASNETICGNSGSVQLTALSNKGSLFWYDAPTGGNLVAIGNSFFTPELTTDKSYYVAANDYGAKAGSPPTPSGGSFSSATDSRLYFDADIPLMLEKVTLTIGTAGSGPRTVTVVLKDRDFSNHILASSVIDVVPGTAAYAVNLFVPVAGENYSLQVTAFGGGTQAYRTTTASLINYPYALPGVLKIKGNNQANPSAYYGYLYNWQVRAVGCSNASRAQATVRVLKNSAPVAVLTGNQSVCEGDSALLNVALLGVAPWTITYTDGTNPVTISNITTSSYRFYVRKAGVYRLSTVRDALNCFNGKFSGSATVTVTNPPTDQPDIIASGPVAFCIGGSVQLSASAGFDQYLWSTGETTRTITVQQSGQFAVAGGVNNCFGPPSDSLAVSAQPIAEKPVIVTSGTLAFCLGDSVTLSAPAGFGMYSWQAKAQPNRVMATTRTIRVKQSGSFTVTVGNIGCSSVPSEAITVVVGQEFPPKPIITALGNRLSSSSETNNQWLLDGQLVPGATQPAYVATTSGKYAVRVTKLSCATVSDEFTVLITGLEPVSKASDSGLQLYPNPATNALSVEYTTSYAGVAPVTVRLCNALGIDLHHEDITMNGNAWKTTLDVSKLLPGVYFVRMNDGKRTVVKPFVKQ